MFQAVGDFVTLKWLREHPFVTTSIAAAAAVYSVASIRNGAEQEFGDNEEPIRMADAGTNEEASGASSARTIRWGDEHGGNLEMFHEASERTLRAQDSATEPAEGGAGTSAAALAPHGLASNGFGGGPKDDPFQADVPKLIPGSDKAELTRTGSDLSMGSASDDPSPSPQWGWFVTMTPPPPQMFGLQSKSGAARGAESPEQPTMHIR